MAAPPGPVVSCPAKPCSIANRSSRARPAIPPTRMLLSTTSAPSAAASRLDCTVIVKLAIQTPHDFPSHPRDGLGALRIEVKEAKLADAENIAGLSETVNHQRRANAAASEYRYLVHELSSIIRRSCEGNPAMPP